MILELVLQMKEIAGLNFFMKSAGNVGRLLVFFSRSKVAPSNLL